MNGQGDSLKIDPVASDQLFGDTKQFASLKPERELMVAVLADAVECYWKYSESRDGAGMRLFREATEWIFDEDEEQPFSFLNVCDALKLDPNYIRRGLRDWRWRRLKLSQGAKSLAGDPSVEKLKRSFKEGAKGVLSFSRGRWRNSSISSKPERSLPKMHRKPR